MTLQVNVQDAKASLSRLISDAEAGEDVVIARAGLPVVRLVPIPSSHARRLGFIPGKVSDEAIKPLGDDELDAWGL
ncbi:MAG: type II toxin-antitoxin system prevent-host-death family antitoxin [Micrococcales bacterium]|nr:type II toxin-antitoxin system prevent-host-death family antitoxin [Micrococcales bacterium]